MRGGRHSILKEGLTPGGRAFVGAWLAAPELPLNHEEITLSMAYSPDDSSPASPTDASFMTLLSTAQHLARDTRRNPRSHMMLIMVAATVTACAVALVAYLLWPTWVARPASAPDRLPVSVGGTLFNVPTAAIRRKIQRHSGPQERVDLNFLFPSLQPPDAPKHVSADTVEEKVQPIDRIFVSISAHHDALAPDLRFGTIYPRRFALCQRGSVFRHDAGPQRALLTRRSHARHVPERAPRRRRRSHLPLSTELAVTMARRCDCDGPPDGADAGTEGIVR